MRSANPVYIPYLPVEPCIYTSFMSLLVGLCNDDKYVDTCDSGMLFLE